MQDDFAGVVTLGDDALQLYPLHDQERADVMLGHLAYGLENGILGFDRIQGPALPIDELFYHRHGTLPMAFGQRLRGIAQGRYPRRAAGAERRTRLRCSSAN